MRMPVKINHNDISFLTSLRGFAAFYVMISHIWYQVWPAVAPPYGYGEHPEGLTALLTGWLYYGHFGVVTFIFISGFCLMIPVMRHGGIHDIRHFFYRRCRRIMPPYYTVLFFSVVLATTVIAAKTGSQWDISVPVTWSGVLSHIFLFQHLVEPTQINYPLWSISVEFHLYLLFPLFVLVWRKMGIWVMAGIVSVSVFTLMMMLFIYEIEDIPPSFLGLVVHFVLGMTCCGVVFGGPLPTWLVRASGPTAIFFFMVLVLTCTSFGHVRAEENFHVIDMIVVAALFCSFIHLSFNTSSVRVKIERPHFQKLGDFSYSLYLTHAPIIHVLWLLLATQTNKTLDFALLLLVATPVTLAWAYLFYLLFERPFQSPRQL